MKSVFKILDNSFPLFILTLFIVSNLAAQEPCQKWTNLEPSQKDEAESAHVVYRGFIKDNLLQQAFEAWNTAYTLAPAADGIRPFHYSDGRKIYMDMFNNESDPSKKKEYAEIILRLYDEQIQCYGQEGNDGFLNGRKAFDMFYYLNSPKEQTLQVLENTVKISGNKTEYVVFDPYARVVVDQFNKEKLTSEKARDIHDQLNKIADINIEKNEKFSEQYKQAKESMNGVFDQIANSIFDCDYFYSKLIPEYQAMPNDRETYLRVYKTLIQKGCDENDPIIAEIKEKDRVYVLEELRQNNKGYAANELYKEGNFSGAIAKYNEAIAESTDNSEKAKYYFSIASIQFRKLSKYSDARASALKAAGLDSSYGKPYELIGDMYAKSARSCGSDTWGQSLAIQAAINKYQRAKSIDPSLASSVNKKINTYNASKPNQELGFMRGVKQGHTAKVPCWIGETVTINY